MQIVSPRKLVHSGKKKAYPSSFVWDCPNCNKWNIWQTKMLMGKTNVQCQDCREKFILNKSEPKETVTRTKDMKTII